MVLPVTGPFDHSYETRDPFFPASGTCTRWDQGRSYRQKKPYNLPLAYFVGRRRTDVRRSWDGRLSYSATFSGNTMWGPLLVPETNESDPAAAGYRLYYRDAARNKALDRFNSKRGDKAALGVALAEAHQSIDMITKRSLQALEAVRALKKLRLGDAARVLGRDFSTARRAAKRRGSHNGAPRTGGPSQDGREFARTLSSLQLEISFGWKAMIGDMYDAMKALSAPLAYESATKAGASITGTYSRFDGSSGPHTAYHAVNWRSQVGAILTVENPNQDLLNRLGLTNPLSVVYELIPFSFVLNWFVNVEEYLSNWTEYYGVSVKNPFYSDVLNDSGSVVKQESFNPSWFQTGSFSAQSFQRSSGSLPSQVLGIRPAARLPVQRAINAVSLLLQIGLRK